MMFFFDWEEYSAQEYLDNVSLLPRCVFDFQAVAVESKSCMFFPGALTRTI